MLIEKELENKLTAELSSILNDDEIQFVGSREVVE